MLSFQAVFHSCLQSILNINPCAVLVCFCACGLFAIHIASFRFGVLLQSCSLHSGQRSETAERK